MKLIGIICAAGVLLHAVYCASTIGNKQEEIMEGWRIKKDVGRGVPSECKFPWIRNGVRFSTCSNPDNDVNGPWCSTKVDASNNHIAGNYEYCGAVCVDKHPKWCPRMKDAYCSWCPKVRKRCPKTCDLCKAPREDEDLQLPKPNRPKPTLYKPTRRQQWWCNPRAPALQ